MAFGSAWVGWQPWCRALETGTRMCWSIQQAACSCHPCLWRRRRKTQQPKSCSSEQVLHVRMIKPRTKRSVRGVTFPAALSISTEGYSTLMLTLTLITNTQLGSGGMGVQEGLLPSLVTRCGLVQVRQTPSSSAFHLS